jgi:ubiquinone/menaquinone biosynthesis C-methylase UbiE
MSTEVNASSEDQDAKLPLKKRFKAWWEGYEIGAATPMAVQEDSEREPEVDDGPPTVKGWSVSRQRSVVTLFGEGMNRCIPDDMKTKLTQPMGIDKTMSVSELGSGLGGFSRWTAETYETYVTGYEEDEELLKASLEMTKMAGLSRNINFSQCDFENFKPKERSANVAYASEVLFTVKNKPSIFSAIRQMLKPSGQFMMSDFMLDGGDTNSPEYLEWVNEEPKTPHLLGVQETRKLMTQCGFEVSIAEDITDVYKANVLRSFADYAKRTSNGEKSGHLHDWILKEGELWTRRVKLMEAGHLKVFRIYARVPVEIS